jgi:hypothetical protein
VFEFNFLIYKTDAFKEFKLTHLVRYNATNVEGDATERFAFPTIAFSVKNNVPFSRHSVIETVGENFRASFTDGQINK